MDKILFLLITLIPVYIKDLKVVQEIVLPKKETMNKITHIKIKKNKASVPPDLTKEFLVFPAKINDLDAGDIETEQTNNNFTLDIDNLKAKITHLNFEIPNQLENIKGNISLKDLNSLGILSKYNEQKAILEFYLPANLNKVQKILNTKRQIEGELLEKPNLSGFLNISSTKNYHQNLDNKTSEDPLFNRFNTAINYKDIVFEGYGHQNEGQGFIREDYRLSKNVNDLRYIVGDVNYSITGFQSFRKTGGISIQSILDDSSNNSISSKISDKILEVKTPSKLTFFINDNIVLIKKVTPGFFDISELPLVNGDNKIKVEIEESLTGEKNTIYFDDFSSDAQIKKGKKLFNVTYGSHVIESSDDRTYDHSDQTLIANFRYDFSNKYSTNSYIETGKSSGILGLIQSYHVKGGKFEVDTALSNSDKTSFAFKISYTKNSPKDLCLFKGDSYSLNYERKQSGFSTIDSKLDNSISSLVLSYSLPKVFKSTGIGVASNFSKNEDLNELSKTYSVLISHSFKNSFTTLNLTQKESPKTNSETSITLSLNLSLDQKTVNLSQSHINKSDTTSLSYNDNQKPGLRGEISNSKNLGYSNQNAQATITTNRNELTLSGSRLAFDTNNNDIVNYGVNNRIGIAFADSSWAIGRPITNSFWISESSKNKNVTLKSGSNSSKKDFFGEPLLEFDNYFGEKVVAISEKDGVIESSNTYKSLKNYYNGYVIKLKNTIDPTVVKLNTSEDISGSIISLKNYRTKKSFDVFIDSKNEFYLEQIETGAYTFELNNKEYILILKENETSVEVNL